MRQDSQPQTLVRGGARGTPNLATGAAILVAILLAGAAALWAHYGTAVFFEMIATGLAACF